VLSTFPNDYDPLAGLRRAAYPFHVNRDFGDEAPSITGAEFIRRMTAWPSEPEEAKRGPRFYELLAELRDLHDRKAHDYAPGEDRFKNFRGCESLGIPAYEGAIVRMLDKVSRITNLVERGKKGDAPAVVDESLIDTFRDLACYALICIELYEDHCARSA
jgi:hypothetical protein